MAGVPIAKLVALTVRTVAKPLSKLITVSVRGARCACAFVSPDPHDAPCVLQTQAKQHAFFRTRFLVPIGQGGRHTPMHTIMPLTHTPT
jgi:hypothetical protein